jgi:hypothetical protein
MPFVINNNSFYLEIDIKLDLNKSPAIRTIFRPISYSRYVVNQYLYLGKVINMFQTEPILGWTELVHYC